LAPFVPKFRIVAGQVQFQTVGLQPGFLPHPMHDIFTHVDRRQLAAIPMSRTIISVFLRVAAKISPAAPASG
jgi:hypothetical protein